MNLLTEFDDYFDELGDQQIDRRNLAPLLDVLPHELIQRFVPAGGRFAARAVWRSLRGPVRNYLLGEEQPEEKRARPAQEDTSGPKLKQQLPQKEWQEEPDTERFPGFEFPGHVLIVGSTGSGKSTNTITMIAGRLDDDRKVAPGLFKFKRFLLNPGSADKENIPNYEKAAKKVIQVDEKGSTENNVMLFPSEEYLNATRADNPSNLETLAIFDDVHASSNKRLETVVKFVMEAKNRQTQCAIITHFAFNSSDEKKLREACRYVVLYNQNEHNFNKILGLEQQNSLFAKYQQIPEKYDRVIIVDRGDLRPKIFYGTGKYLEFNSLLK